MQKYIDKALANPLPLAGGVILIIGAVYFLARKTVTDTVDFAAGLVSGDNAITKNQTNFAGEEVTAYEGKGVLGTLGAVFNSVSGGGFASIGESISGWFSSDLPDGFLTTYMIIFPDGVRHAVNGDQIDKNGYFTYGGRKYRMGYNQSSQKVAVPV